MKGDNPIIPVHRHECLSTSPEAKRIISSFVGVSAVLFSVSHFSRNQIATRHKFSIRGRYNVEKIFILNRFFVCAGDMHYDFKRFSRVHCPISVLPLALYMEIVISIPFMYVCVCVYLFNMYSGIII